MAAVSNILILLDLLDAGLKINSKITAYIRQVEEDGGDISAEQLKSLADESDEAFEKFKEVFK